MPYLRFASVTLYPSNEDLSLAVGAILRSFSYPSASLVCAKAECKYNSDRGFWPNHVHAVHGIRMSVWWLNPCWIICLA